MNRIAQLGLLTMVGCGPSLSLDLNATLEAETQGVALDETGRVGHAGMFEMTCEFSTDTADIIGDYDLPTDSEQIHDAFEGRALGVSTLGIHPIHDDVTEIARDHVVQARFTNDGFVALVNDPGGCGVEWYTNQGALEHQVHVGGTCDGARAAVDRDGDLYIATLAETLQVTRSGVTPIDIGADLLAYNDRLDAVITANLGDNRVRVQQHGQEKVLPVDGEVVGLDDLGRFGSLAVMTQGAGITQLTFFDDDDRVVLESELPEPATVVVSENGGTVALVTEAEVYLYDVVEGDQVVNVSESDDQQDAPVSQD